MDTLANVSKGVDGSDRIRGVIELPVRQRGCCAELSIGLGEQEAAAAADIMKALADPTRLRMLSALRSAEGPVCICDLTASFDLGQPTISHHMAKLREMGLVESSRAGIWSFYRLRSELPARIRTILDAVLA